MSNLSNISYKKINLFSGLNRLLFWQKEKKMQDNFKDTKGFLLKISDLDLEEALDEMGTTRQGISLEEVESRQEKYGKNDVAREKPPTWYKMLFSNFGNPFILVLFLLGIVSFLTDDIPGTIIVSIMVAISVLMRFAQEFRSSREAETLRAMVRVSTLVRRRVPGDEYQIHKKKLGKKEIPLEELVPGDIVYISAGDMIPADVRLISSKDLVISQSALTGESVPVEKNGIPQLFVEKTTQLEVQESNNPLERSNLCFMGTTVVSGYGKAMVISTGSRTYFGSLAKSVVGHKAQTSFDKGINSITWLLIKFIVVMVPIIFFINGFLKGEWKDAFLFAISVAVGLTPEMLPMIVTANLAKGAMAMSRFKVIVKQLNSIQSLGAMDILCTDKTGTLTQDKIILEKYLDTSGEEDNTVLEYGYLNSYYQSGLKNVLDKAILGHSQLDEQLDLEDNYKKIDEIPFDFIRKKLSVVVKDSEQHIFICKGAVEEVLKVCSDIKIKGEIVKISKNHLRSFTDLADGLGEDGFRVIAIAYKTLPLKDTYSIEDENELILLGLMAFLDPPKETAAEAIEILNGHRVGVKVLTGDNGIVTKKVCQEVGLPCEKIILGDAIEEMSEEELQKEVEETHIFAKLAPLQKARIIKALQKNGHIVGFLGDGINDTAALREADVGISVDTATDIARESAAIILLEKSLLVLGEGVLKGREVYGNIIKYVKMTTSSNFGNVFSVLVASIFLPFLPMMPLQLLIQNLLYDFSQTSVPWDRMDSEFLKKPRTWDPKGIARFMVFLGPTSSIFDMTTFLLMWFVFQANSIEHQALFQSGWFVEGLLSQTLIVHMIRTKKIPFIQSTASFPVIVTTAIIMGIGIYLPYSFLASNIQLVQLPASYFGYLLLTLLSYCALTQLVKIWYIKRFRAWL